MKQLTNLATIWRVFVLYMVYCAILHMLYGNDKLSTIFNCYF